MSEATLRFFIYLVNSIAGSLYVQKLLQKKYKKEITLLVWAGSYFVIQSLVFGNINENGFIGVLADIAILLLLQAVLYQSDFSAKLFTAVSFTAGKDIIKYIITGVSSSLYWFIREGGFLEVAAKKITTAEEVNTWSSRISSGINLIVLLFYAILLTVYLSILSKKFVKRDYQLRAHEYAFLILPSAATLCISVTLRMLILYVENGFTMTIFERVPATMFWVPLICFLLLGIIVSSAILFQKMVQLNEEERERVQPFRARSAGWIDHDPCVADLLGVDNIKVVLSVDIAFKGFENGIQFFLHIFCVEHKSHNLSSIKLYHNRLPLLV